MENELEEVRSQKKAGTQKSKMLQQTVKKLQKTVFRQDQLSEELRIQQNQYSAKLKELIGEWTDKLHELEKNKPREHLRNEECSAINKQNKR